MQGALRGLAKKPSHILGKAGADARLAAGVKVNARSLQARMRPE